MFTLSIKTDNAAFHESESEPAEALEVARILRAAADKLEAGVTVFNVFDANGNNVGQARLA